jgi:tRNA A37 threonylcarbamoyltransferase TsaD/predicted alpha/beta hydrolase family esterase
MIVLGIESTAHTFGIGIVQNGKVVANVRRMYSTDEGGIIPMEAAKHHCNNKNEIYFEALSEAKIVEGKVDVIAFSQGPGLAPCLLEGMKFAQELSKKLKKPVVGVNHCISHLEIGKLTGAKDPVMLYASGANTQIIAYEAGKYRIFGETLDLGVGNFIDTVARFMGIGFPGGPAIEKLAKECVEKSFGDISNVVIIHGSNAKDRENMKRYNLPPQNERNWIPWIKSQLDEKGVSVFAPLMPENWKPSYKKWKKEFEKIDVNKDSVLVGHSAGGGFLVRWLGETGKKIKKLILVAPAIAHSLGEGWEVEEFYKFSINKNIKKNVGEVVLLESSNDSDGLRRSGEIFSKELRVKQIILDNRGHFTNRGNGENMKFPELINEIVSSPNYIELPYKVKGMDITLAGIQTKIKQLLEKGEKIKDLAYSLQETVFAMLVETAERALAHTGKKELLLGGGVGCNSRLQEMCKIMCKERGCKFFVPERSLLVDNGAMIAFLGEIMFKKGIKEKGKIDIHPRERTDQVDVVWK